MLFDGIKLLSGSVAQNLNIKTGLTFPVNGTEGELFYIKEGAAFTEGLYVYDGAAWNLTNNVLTALEISTALGYTPLSGNQSISVTGDATGSGATSIALTLSASGVTAGSYGSATLVPTFTVDAKGRVTAAGTTTIAPAFSSITAKPTTLTGYGISDAVNKTGDTMSGNLVISTGAKLTLADAPTVGTDAVNKNYVDAAIAGLTWKNGVKALATSNITLSGTQTVDGVALVAGDRVLVSGQTDAKTNGIYVVASGAWTRSTDADTGAELAGLGVWVNGGTVYADTGWTCTNDTVTLGTDSISFVQFNGASGITAGIGLIKTGNTLSVGLGAGIAQLPSTEVGVDVYVGGGLMLTTDGSAPSTVSAAQLALTNSGVAAGSYNNVTVDAKGRVTAGTNPTTLAGYGITDAVSSSATIDVANGGTGATSAEAATTNLGASRINPTTPKDGDVKVAAGPTISIYATGAWRQVFPAVYS